MIPKDVLALAINEATERALEPLRSDGTRIFQEREIIDLLRKENFQTWRDFNPLVEAILRGLNRYFYRAEKLAAVIATGLLERAGIAELEKLLRSEK